MQVVPLVLALGQPDGVQAVPSWQRCCRVNVLTGKDRASARIARSYFLVTDVAGTSTEASPEIAKTY